MNRKPLAFLNCCAVPVAALQAEAPATDRTLVDKNCVACHSDKLKTGGLMLQSADLNRVPENALGAAGAGPTRY